MRAAALLLLAVTVTPTALAGVESHHRYVVLGAGCAGGGLMRNCEWYTPPPGATSVTARADDVSGAAVRVRICHEWTYDDGSHPTLRCDVGCRSVTSSVLFPTRSDAYYRVNVDLRDGPGGCERAATAGELRTMFS